MDISEKVISEPGLSLSCVHILMVGIKKRYQTKN